MKYQFCLFLALMSLLGSLSAQPKPAYVLYSAKGKKVSYQKMLRQAQQQDVVLFGEFHNNPISHWLELELAKDLQQSGPIVLGAEMLEADNQQALDDYLAGTIDAAALDTLARLWSNYPTDYAPLVDFAAEQKIPFIATNIPRRYAAQVYQNGGFAALESLTEEEKAWIAPLPITFDPELPQYQNILEMMAGHGSPELVKAQAIKDATMAHFILQNRQAGAPFLHFNGAYHSDFYEGILWYLQLQAPDLRYTTITTVEQDDIQQLEKEHLGRADFIICVDQDMTKTY
jgi:uncharacterized iron-regulated protein